MGNSLSRTKEYTLGNDQNQKPELLKASPIKEKTSSLSSKEMKKTSNDSSASQSNQCSGSKNISNQHKKDTCSSKLQQRDSLPSKTQNTKIQNKTSTGTTQNLPKPFQMSYNFKKRSGTTDLGKNYEHLYIANLILKLILDDSVEDFHISSNDPAFGSFDDVVIQIKYYAKTQRETFAIQTKHFNSYKTLTSDALEAPSGNFSISKYLDDCDENSIDGTVKFILLTNCNANFQNKKIQVESNELELVQCEQNHLISTSTKGHCFAFNSAKCEKFFENFFLYTNQENVNQLERKISELFRITFNINESKVVAEYINFITKWSLDERKKYALNKEWMMKTIFLQIVTQFTKTLAFSPNQNLHEKQLILRDAISSFDIVAINKCHYDALKQLWINSVRNLTDLTQVNKVKNNYQLEIPTIKEVEDLNLEDINITKLMWLLNKCPLVIKGNPQVYTAIKICKQNELIVLENPKNFEEKFNDSKFKTFLRLSDLQKHSSIYQKILGTFTFSLEGQQNDDLKYLIDMDKEFLKIITTDELCEMLKGPLFVGKNTQTLPVCYIERKVSKVLIEFQFLDNIPENTIVTIENVTNPENFEQSLPKDLTVIKPKSEYDINFDTWQKGSRFIYISSRYLDRKIFENLNLDGLEKIHHFRYLKGCLELITSRNYKNQEFDEIEKFRKECNDDATLSEYDLINNENKINIICANSGMGKSTFMNRLKQRTTSSIWCIVIHARNHALYFRKNEKNVDKFLEYIFREKFKQDDGTLHYKVCKTLMGRGKIQIIWDGLDEISEKSLDTILTMVELLSRKPMKQFLTSRKNLKCLLERRLYTLSRTIVEFNEKEQQAYIKKRLGITPKELPSIFGKITSNIVCFSNRNVLGIPLQIFMLTELLFQNREKYLNEIEIFTILDLYQHFVDEQFKVLYVVKLKQDLSIETNYEKYETEKIQKLCFYKNVASNLYLDVKNEKFCNESLEKIEKSGDDVGFVNFVNKNTLAFSHNSYGEYFTALFLFENHPEKVRNSSFFTKSKYNNIRFFLDLMLSQNHKAFVAVLYKNVSLLDQCTEDDFNQKDVIGRDVLEVASSWAENDTDQSFLINSCKEITQDFTYENISKYFDKMKTVPFVIKKLMYLVPFLVLLYDIKHHNFNRASSYCLLYFAIKFDYSKIFDNTENTLQLDETFDKTELTEIIHLTMYFNSRKILQKMFDFQKIQNDTLIKILPDVLQNLNGKRDVILTWMLKNLNINFLNSITIHSACEKYNGVVVQLLLDHGVNLNDLDEYDRTALHCAIENTHFYYEIIEILLNNGAKTEVEDAEGQLPIYYAWVFNKFDAVQLLVNEGANLEIPDAYGDFLIHKACQQGLAQLTDLLYGKGGQINVQNSVDETPLHKACQYGYIDIVNFLVEKGAKLDISDVWGELPIHKACQGGYTGIVEFLIKRKAKINIPDGSGELPIHKACYSGKVDVVKLLIRKGAEIDIPNASGELPIDKALDCGNVDVVKLLQNY